MLPDVSQLKLVCCMLLATMLVANKADACANADTKELKDGTIVYQDGVKGERIPYGHYFKDAIVFTNALPRMDSLYKATGNIDYLSDKGLLYIYLHQYQKAVDLYLQIEKKHPGRYSTASNLGTAYELAGNNEQALYWINKSVLINPKSHFASEWIHVNILKAKIKGEKAYTTSFLLNTEFGTDSLPTTTLNKEKLELLYEALFYQLNERVSFVRPTDKIVAQLLFDLGNIAYLAHNNNYARANYTLAEKYGYSGQLLQQRLLAAGKVLPDKIAKPQQHLKNEGQKKGTPVLWFGIGALFFLLIAIGVKRARRKKDI